MMNNGKAPTRRFAAVAVARPMPRTGGPAQPATTPKARESARRAMLTGGPAQATPAAPRPPAPTMPMGGGGAPKFSEGGHVKGYANGSKIKSCSTKPFMGKRK